jgi:hypothetical protein
MKALLGMNDEALEVAEGQERMLYATVSWWLVANVIFSLVGNAFFGFLSSGSWFLTAALGLLMGFIHFSILRLAMITLVTKPLAEEQTDQVLTSEDLKKQTVKLQAFFAHFRFLNGAFILRVFFVGAIALTAALPFGAFMQREEAFAINEAHRLHVLKELKYHEAMGTQVLKEAHYPITVLEELWNKNATFRIQVILVMLSFFAPVALLYWLRESKTFQYVSRLKELSRTAVMIDYHETIEQSQYALDQNFPLHGYQLSQLSNHEDAPFNTKFKGELKRKVADRAAFIAHLKSIA